MASDLASELRDSATAMSALSRDQDTFDATFDAFRAADQESFRRLLEEHKLLGRCHLVCEWIRSKECVLVCLELAGDGTGGSPDTA
jgi:hypothetical protein